MARLGTTFDATTHDTEQRDYAELPNGIYVIEMTASDVIEKDGGCVVLKTTFDVVEPEQYRGRKLFNNYNLENPSSEAARIGKAQFASLCRAIGKTTVEDSEDLHLRSFTVKVGLGKPSKDGKYPARAEIKRYYFADSEDVPPAEIDANQPAAAPARPANDNRPAPAAAPAKAATGTKPWGGKSDFGRSGIGGGHRLGVVVRA